MSRHYFAYGSNLNLGELAGRGVPVESMQALGPAWLPDRELAFDYLSRSRGGGALDVVHCMGQAVPGVVFAVDDAVWPALDQKEGVGGRYYQRLDTVALTPDGRELPVTTYEACPDRRTSFQAPTDAYVELVRDGRAAFGLPTPDLERMARGKPAPPEVAGLFVYGTLMQRECRAQCLNDVLAQPSGFRVKPAEVVGRLVDLGEYPGLVPANPTEQDAWVQGEFLAVAPDLWPSVLQTLDRIEGFRGFGLPGSLFRRALVDVHLGGPRGVRRAWTYVLGDPAAAGHGIASGDWRWHRGILPERLGGWSTRIARSSKDLLRTRQATSSIALQPAEFLRSTPTPGQMPAWQRVEGMLLGLAIGDALGNTSESMTPRARRERHGEIRDYLPNRHGGYAAVGVPSDDTQLAAWTIEVLVEHGKLNLDALALRIATREVFGMGRTVRAFREAVLRDVPLGQCAQRRAGNGALMRIAPVVLAHLRTPGPALWADAALAGALTHDDPASNAACVAFVAMLWELLHMAEPPAPAWWWQRFVALAGPLEGTTTYLARDGTGWRGTLTERVAACVPAALAANEPVAIACDRWHSGAFLLETVPAALYVLARHAQDPEEALVRAVNDAWDNDTVAAIVGAAVGALHGTEQLPRRWREGLLGRTGAADDGTYQELLQKARWRFGPREGMEDMGLTAAELLAHYPDPAVAVLAALMWRGFLIERDDTHFWLSDNSENGDPHGLAKAFSFLGIGLGWAECQRKERILLADLRPPQVAAAECLVRNALRLWPVGQSETCGPRMLWQHYRQRQHGIKVTTAELDGDLALFIKGLSACGVMTVYSCVGHNAAGDGRLNVGLASTFDRPWMEALFRLCSLDRYLGHSEALLHIRDPNVGGLGLIGPHRGDRAALDAIRRIGATLYGYRLAARRARMAALAVVSTDNEGEAVIAFTAACATVVSDGAEGRPDAGLLTPWILRSGKIKQLALF